MDRTERTTSDDRSARRILAVGSIRHEPDQTTHVTSTAAGTIIRITPPVATR